jgi:sugar phosphate isomerase/epimerase
MFHLAFSTLGCPGWSLERIAEFAGQHGFAGVELRTHDDGIHFSPQATVDDAGRIERLFSSRGVRVFSLMAYTTFVSAKEEERAANRDRLLHILDLAQAAGAGFIRTFVGRLNQGTTREEALARAAEGLAPCCEKARRLKISLGIETHDDWCHPDNIRALQERVGGGLGAVWDIANATHGSGRTVDEQYRGLRGTVLYCHIKDTVKGDDGKIRYVPVGQGQIELRRAVELLREDGRDLFLSFEHEKKWHPELPEPEEAFPQYLRFMRGLVDGG